MATLAQSSAAGFHDPGKAALLNAVGLATQSAAEVCRVGRYVRFLVHQDWEMPPEHYQDRLTTLEAACLGRFVLEEVRPYVIEAQGSLDPVRLGFLTGSTWFDVAFRIGSMVVPCLRFALDPRLDPGEPDESPGTPEEAARAAKDRLRRAWQSRPEFENFSDSDFENLIGRIENLGVLAARLIADLPAASEPKAEAPVASETPAAAPVVTRGWLGGDELANALGVLVGKREAFRKALNRARAGGGLPDSAWNEGSDGRPNEPRFLYRADAAEVLNVARKYR